MNKMKNICRNGSNTNPPVRKKSALKKIQRLYYVLLVLTLLTVVIVSRVQLSIKITYDAQTKLPKLIDNNGWSLEYWELLQNFPTINFRHHELVYLHVGKTGGVSLDRVLRSNCQTYGSKKRRQDCDRFYTVNNNTELELSKVTKKTFHVKLNHIKKDATNSFLWTIRNPVDRAVSAFDMSHINNTKGRSDSWATLFYERCGFQTAQVLANALDRSNRMTTKNTNHYFAPGANHTHPSVVLIEEWRRPAHTDKSLDCLSFGSDTLTGTGVKSHLYYNYAHYYEFMHKLLANKTNHQSHSINATITIFVLRTEHLWDDVIQTNTLMLAAKANITIGGTTNDNNNPRSKQLNHHRNGFGSKLMPQYNFSQHKHTHGSEAYSVKSTLDRRGKEIFCCYLSNENQIYQDLLQAAVNLSDQQKVESLSKLYKDCGIHYPTLSSIGLQPRIGSGTLFPWKEWRSKGCPRATTVE